jgi:4-amino-4-deoxy-L-arabinose transferase-like glycosyltransferase
MNVFLLSKLFKTNYNVIILISLFISRSFYYFFMYDNNRVIVGDEWEYVEVAKNILLGKGFWNPERGGEIFYSEPIFPILIALCIFISGAENLVIVLNILLTFFAISFYIKVMIHFKIRKKIIILVIMYIASHPYLCFYNFRFLAESLRFFGLSIIIYSFFRLNQKQSRFNFFLVGISSGLSSLIRYPFLFIVVFLIPAISFYKKYLMKNIIIIIGAFLLIISPWLLRNYLVTGDFPVFLDPNTSIYDRFVKGLKPETIFRITDNKKYQALGGNWGITNDDVIDKDIRAENRIYVTMKLLVLRFYEFFKPYPGADSGYSTFVKMLSGLYNIPMLIFGFFGVFYAIKEEAFDKNIILLGPILILTFIHCISNAPHSRYSLPLLPVLLILGTKIIEKIYKRINSV